MINNTNYDSVFSTDNLAKLFDVDKSVILQIDEWHKQYVPDFGDAKCIGGNLIRNLEKVLYRFVNDGEIAYSSNSYEFIDSVMDELSDEFLDIIHSINLNGDLKTIYDARRVVSKQRRNKNKQVYAQELGKLAKGVVELLNCAKEQNFPVFGNS